MPVSISLGCATKVNIDEDIDIILKEAEERLYKQKLLTKLNSRTSVLEELNETLKQKSIETKQHTNRVWHYAKRLGVKMALDDRKIKDLEIVAQLHDIGKIGIEEYILSKPGKLTKEEFEIIKTHTEKGYRIANINDDISHVANDILCHHERWDGKGYPLGLKGEEIPLLSRIICIIDSYDAMTSERTYKVEMSKEEALDEIKRNSGTQFDPHIVDIFLKEFEN